MTKAQADKEAAIKRLRELLPPGATVYAILRHVSRSGMQRRISFYSADHAFLDGYIGSAVGIRRASKGEGLVVNGCGMDMGFHVVYELGYTLYGDDFQCIGDRCPSNDHNNGDRDYTPHKHSDGGYALRCSWL